VKNVVNVNEARTQFSKLFERAHRGETIVLAKAGKPYARLVPLEGSPPRKPGALKGKFKLTKAFVEPLPEEELRSGRCVEACARHPRVAFSERT
jgi:prevent-host-death family protein